MARPYYYGDITRRKYGQMRVWDGNSLVKELDENLALRIDLKWRANYEPGAREWLIDKCKNDCKFWINYFCYTYDPRKKDPVTPFITYQFQDEAIDKIISAIDGGRDVAIKKSRDMGASWINLIVIMWMWQFRSMKNFLLVSRNESYVDGNQKSLFWKLRFLYEHQPKWLRPRIGEGDDKMMHLRNADNGSAIDGESTTGEVARGDRRTAILMDEFASFDVKSGYNAYAATQSATDCRIFNSTPKGVANCFYDVVHKSAADIVSMHWSQHPEKSRGLYSSERDGESGKMKVKLMDDFHGFVEVRTKGEGGSKRVAYPEDYPFILDGKLRSPWYDLQCARAVTQVEIAQELDIDFQGSDYSFFDPIAIERYKDNYCRDPEAIGELDFYRETYGVIGFTNNDKGHMSLYEMPNGSGRWDADRKFVMGCDVSAGTGASNSTIAIYDAKTTEKVAEYANPNILPDDFGRLAVAVCRWFNNALIVPDRSGPTGEVFVTRIRAEAPDINIYRQRDSKKISSPISDKEGVFLNPAMRTTILLKYRDAIGRCAIINRSFLAMDETLRFICKMDGNIEHSAATNAKDPSGAGANHGDRVISDALAALALFGETTYETAKDIEIPEGSLAWRMEMSKREDESNVPRDNLGSGWEV